MFQSSLLQLSWVVWVAAAVFLNAALQWKRHFPTVLQDTLLYGKVKLGTASPVPLLNVPKKWVKEKQNSHETLFYFISSAGGSRTSMRGVSCGIF